MVSVSRPVTVSRCRPRGERRRNSSIWPTALTMVVARTLRSANTSRPELKSGFGTGSTARPRRYVQGERLVMAVMNRCGVDGCPSRSRVRAGVRRSVPDRYWRIIVRRDRRFCRPGGPGHGPVGRLVDGAVTAEHDDQLTARRGGQLASMAAVPGMFYVKVDQPGERTDRQIRGVPRRGGRLRVNDQEASHSLRLASA